MPCPSMVQVHGGTDQGVPPRQITLVGRLARGKRADGGHETATRPGYHTRRATRP